MKLDKQKTKLFYNIIYDLFIISLAFYIVFTWIDRAFGDYISYYFNLNIILVIVFVTGFLTILRRARKVK